MIKKIKLSIFGLCIMLLSLLMSYMGMDGFCVIFVVRIFILIVIIRRLLKFFVIVLNFLNKNVLEDFSRKFLYLVFFFEKFLWV